MACILHSGVSNRRPGRLHTAADPARL